ncbi:MAG: antibiotic biosynthesis monooxygenase family protein, partial [Candidatus Eremiobacterota bacterium]
MLRVLAAFQVQSGKEAELMAALKEVARPTRAEPGCLEYELHRCTEDPTRFVMLEKWTSPDALQAHFNPSDAFRRRAALRMTGPDARRARSE